MTIFNHLNIFIIFFSIMTAPAVVTVAMDKIKRR